MTGFLILLALAPAAGAAPPLADGGDAARIAALTAGLEKRGLAAAVTPLEALAPDPAFVGTLWLDQSRTDPPALVRQPLRAVDGVALQVEGRRRVLPLAIVGPVEKGADGPGRVPEAPGRRAWCDGKDRHAGGIRCYQDLDGDGRMETARPGYAVADRNPATLVRLGPPEGIAPLPYAHVAPAERPAYTLIYQHCRGEQRIYYAARLGVEGDGDIKSLGCDDAAVPLSAQGHSAPGRYRVDRAVIDVAVTPPPPARDGQPAERVGTARLVSAVPVGTLLDRIDAGKPVLDLGMRPPWPVEELGRRIALSRPAYQFAAEPTVTASGTAATPFLTGTLRYGFTGRVRENAARSGAWMIDRHVAFVAGQPVYGVPMSGPTMPRTTMMWCGPRLDEGKWRGTCVQGEGIRQIVFPRLDPFIVRQIQANNGNGSDPVEVTPGPAEFPGPITVSYRVARWGRKVVGLVGEVQAPVGPPARFWLDVPRDTDGTGRFVSGDGELALTQRADGGFEARLARPLVAGSSILPAEYSTLVVGISRPAPQADGK